MLFNSYVYLLAFLPASLLLQAAVERWWPGWRRHTLLALSLFFYGYRDWRFTPLLLGSILANWTMIRPLARSRSRLVLGAAIAGNLLVLAAFKYLALLMQASNLLGLFGVEPFSLALPLGISFFTFHHIMYLTDLRAGRAPVLGVVDYGLYIAFFPQVLAGPLVRWSELVHQLAPPSFRPGFEERIGRGLVLLTVGLCKKVLIGDPLAGIAAPAFDAATAGSLDTGAAWDGLLAFTFQIYFDFSGYTDMALGAALMLGVVLPQNFETPYRAASIAEFWRRWHMTLSRFLRDYLYIPLGGNRRGLAVQIAALFVTMTLGGLWHGAGVTFLLWGAAQGLALVVHLLWRRAGCHMPAIVGVAMTFAFVAVGWVLFRAPSVAAAGHFYAALLGATSHGRPHHLSAVATAAAIATLGPTSWQVAQRIAPSPGLAVAAAGAAATALLSLADSSTYEFIYFRF